MPISKTFTVPSTGATAQHHIVKRLEARQPFTAVDVDVQSFTTAEAYTAGLAPVWSSPLQLSLATPGDVPTVSAIETWLISNSASPLQGGTIV